ncbi:Vesicle transport v-SNARE 12 [Linum perenne]
MKRVKQRKEEYHQRIDAAEPKCRAGRKPVQLNRWHFDFVMASPLLGCLGFRKIQVESDCLDVVELVVATDSDIQNHPRLVLGTEIKKLLSCSHRSQQGFRFVGKNSLSYSPPTIAVMSNIFEGYERQYCELSANLSRKCNSASLLPDGDERREKLHGVDDAIDKSKKVLTSMSRRISRNKWIVGSVIAALVFAIILIISFKLF